MIKGPETIWMVWVGGFMEMRATQPPAHLESVCYKRVDPVFVGGRRAVVTGPHRRGVTVEKAPRQPVARIGE